MTDAKPWLLDLAVARLAESGVGGVSLRELAAAIGTSHRMLIYHFGSKEGLLVEVVKAVERRQRDLLAELRGADDVSPAELMRQFWRRVSDQANWPHIRLFFELYGQALQGRPGTTALLDGIVESWLAPAAAVAVRQGMSPVEARANARVQLALARGLLLDLLATGDRSAVDEAVEHFIDVVTAHRSGES